jgi:hypothetical protein
MQRIEAIRLILRLSRFLPLVLSLLIVNRILTTPVFERRQMQLFARPADELLQGRSVWLSSWERERPLKVALLARLPTRKAVLVFGGSRASQISAAWFKPNSALNLAVIGGGLDDTVAFFQMCTEVEKIPSLVVLELNPALLRDELSVDSLASARYFNNAVARYGLQPQQRFGSGLLSLERIRLISRFFVGGEWKVVRADDPRLHLLPDGSWCLTLAKRNQSAPQVDAFVTSFLRNLDPDYFHLRTTSRPSEFERSLLGHFLDDLQTRHIRVVVLLAPVHPIAYEYYRKRGGYEESWIRAEMASRGITVAGSYSPFVTGATSADFFDDVHPRAAIVYRLLREAGVFGALPPPGGMDASALTAQKRSISGG